MLALAFSYFLVELLSSALILLLKSFHFSIHMYFAALCLNSAMLVAGLLHKLSTKGVLHSVLIIWCRATSGFKLSMLRASFPKRSMNVLKDSPSF